MQTNQIAFCYSGTKIFVTTSEGRIRILSYPDFQPVLNMRGGDEEREFMLNGHTSSCLTAEVQPTARYLATGGSDSIIALWDTTDWICQRTLTKMTGAVRSISMFFYLFFFFFFLFFLLTFLFPVSLVVSFLFLILAMCHSTYRVFTMYSMT